ncbi:MAG: hypothetical protein IJ220_08770 [Clostridia bacterium]|nr:hypothetical protein [Clostridia bacterium]
MAIINVEKERRKDFIEKFEKKGFKIESRFSREGIIGSVLPITLDFETKEIGRIGNVTCACVASKHGMVLEEDKFLITLDNIKKFHNY